MTMEAMLTVLVMLMGVVGRPSDHPRGIMIGWSHHERLVEKDTSTTVGAQARWVVW